MKHFRMTVLAAVVVAVLSICSSPLIAVDIADEDIPAEGVTQGEFAMWLVEAAGAQDKLPPAALQSDAIKFLTNLGIKPKEGWDAEKKLTRDDILDMLGLSKKEREKLADKSWNDLIRMLVDLVIELIQQLQAANQGIVSPSISPSGTR